ncbi:ketol-acid reductoisomerase, partial [Actinoplanes sp. ATCC 53533]|jgi:ketol-acid reductoisomerase
VKQEMKKILAEIQSGEFTKALIADDEAGGPALAQYRKEGAEHPIEVTGKKLRDMMSWVDRPITETA